MPGLWLWGLVTVLIALLGALGWFAWDARRREQVEVIGETQLANGVRGQIREKSAPIPDPRQTSRTTVPQTQPFVDEAPPRIDLSLRIESATRSVMMFTLEYRLTICNRSDRAVRDLMLGAQLASAQRGVPGEEIFAQAQPIGAVDRIGPQQSQTIKAMTQLSLRDVVAMRQGTTPLFVPLLHITLEGGGQPATTRSFVIGSPSASSVAKLHPIPLDTPPGGISGLRANEIRDPAFSELA